MDFNVSITINQETLKYKEGEICFHKNKVDNVIIILVKK